MGQPRKKTLFGFLFWSHEFQLFAFKDFENPIFALKDFAGRKRKSQNKFFDRASGAHIFFDGKLFRVLFVVNIFK